MQGLAGPALSWGGRTRDPCAAEAASALERLACRLVRTQPPPFTAEIVNAANPVVIRASGELDIATVGSLQTCFESAARNGGPVEVDMTEVTFMDSAGCAR